MYKGDFIRTLLHASKGKSRFINELMSVYRITGQGDWSKTSEIQRCIAHIKFYYFHRNHTFDAKYKKSFNIVVVKEMMKLIKIILVDSARDYMSQYITKLSSILNIVRRYCIRAMGVNSKSNYLNVSWSQHGEDNILLPLLNYKKDGFYVDIGAHHPYRFSNTCKFYNMGWKGINIDAMPGSKKLFDQVRPGDINLELGINDTDGELVYNIFDENALNTFSSEMVSEAYLNYGVKPISQRKIKAITLASCLDEFMPANTPIDLMNVDCEGLDYAVLSSNDWSKYKPRVIVCEIENSNIDKIIKSDIHHLLSSLGYQFFAKTVLSCIFLHKREVSNNARKK